MRRLGAVDVQGLSETWPGLQKCSPQLVQELGPTYNFPDTSERKNLGALFQLLLGRSRPFLGHPSDP